MKRLVIRNHLPKEVLLKLFLSPDTNKFVQLENDRLRIAGKTMIYLEMRIDMEKFFKGSHQLIGYIRVMDGKKMPDLDYWINTMGIEKNHQKAFVLDIRFENSFSAKDTVIDLPGSALITQDRNGEPIGVDDMEQIEASDVMTARNCDSMYAYLDELKKEREKGEAEDKCWLMSWVIGGK